MTSCGHCLRKDFLVGQMQQKQDVLLIILFAAVIILFAASLSVLTWQVKVCSVSPVSNPDRNPLILVQWCGVMCARGKRLDQVLSNTLINRLIRVVNHKYSLELIASA